MHLGPGLSHGRTNPFIYFFLSKEKKKGQEGILPVDKVVQPLWPGDSLLVDGTNLPARRIPSWPGTTKSPGRRGCTTLLAGKVVPSTRRESPSRRGCTVNQEGIPWPASLYNLVDQEDSLLAFFHERKKNFLFLKEKKKQ
jgi:hypothetical protein